MLKKALVAIVLIMVVCSVCYAQNTDKNTAKTKVKVNNTICPVTGNPVNMKDPVTVEYNGKIYNLCCSMCPETFKSNPEKYSKIAEDQAKGGK